MKLIDLLIKENITWPTNTNALWVRQSHNKQILFYFTPPDNVKIREPLLDTNGLFLRELAEDWVESNISKEEYLKAFNLFAVGDTVEYNFDSEGSNWKKVEIKFICPGIIIVEYFDNHFLVYNRTRLRKIKEFPDLAKDLYYAVNWAENPNDWELVSEERKKDYKNAIDQGWKKE